MSKFLLGGDERTFSFFLKFWEAPHNPSSLDLPLHVVSTPFLARTLLDSSKRTYISLKVHDNSSKSVETI